MENRPTGFDTRRGQDLAMRRSRYERCMACNGIGTPSFKADAAIGAAVDRGGYLGWTCFQCGYAWATPCVVPATNRADAQVSMWTETP